MYKENGKIKKWVDPKLNVIIPMAGGGTRFEESDHVLPKPLISVNQKPMIQVAVENLNMDANYIYIVQKQHFEEYDLKELLNSISPDCDIVQVDGVTEGAACTALLAKQFFDNDEPLFFANSDQFVEWDSAEFLKRMIERDADGGIVTFESTNPHFSYVELDKDGFVTLVDKGNRISNIATVGFYYWKKGSDFVKYARQMVSKGERTNGEFYIDPVYNEAIKDGKKVTTYKADRFWSLGTPKELDYFLEFYRSIIIFIIQPVAELNLFINY